MPEAVLKIENLNKTLGTRQILHDISFEAYAGEVFGFLGPNGAGKTTTIKCAVGLISIDSGKVEVDGKDVNKDFEGAMAQIGAIVENPEMYKYLTAKQNLEQYARMRDGVTAERINEVVELVGLSNRMNEKISKYSLGMRQRLGVAQALLHDPKLLILDEPTNGLDAAGIKELRDILKQLAHEKGVCVLVSSHLMSEMELMCDRVGIITNGKMLGVYTLEEMISSSNGQTEDYIIKCGDAAAAMIALDSIENITKKLTDEHIEVNVPIDSARDTIALVNRQIMLADIPLYEVTVREKKKLEEVFIEMTQNGGDQIE
ncbi:MAG: ABC transporter ATP-binding protein [Ruminococcus sp.]|nr:ABC transporter ATP-binding protein [Ruminococcus sp.]